MDSEDADGPAPDLDFEKQLWLIEIFYSNALTQHVVNADNKLDAWHAGILEARKAGEPWMTLTRIEVAALENLKGGE